MEQKNRLEVLQSIYEQGPSFKGTAANRVVSAVVRSTGASGAATSLMIIGVMDPAASLVSAGPFFAIGTPYVREITADDRTVVPTYEGPMNDLYLHRDGSILIGLNALSRPTDELINAVKVSLDHIAASTSAGLAAHDLLVDLKNEKETATASLESLEVTKASLAALLKQQEAQCASMQTLLAQAQETGDHDRITEATLALKEANDLLSATTADLAAANEGITTLKARLNAIPAEETAALALTDEAMAATSRAQAERDALLLSLENDAI